MDNTEQKGLLEDLILEMMESNQNMVAVDKKLTMSNDYLNNVNANTWATFEQLHVIAEIMRGNNLTALEKAKEDGILQQRMIDALKGIEENTKEKKKAKDLDMNVGFGGILGGLVSFLGGFISGYITQFKKVAKAYYNVVKEIFVVLTKWTKASFNWLTETNLFKNIRGKVVSWIAAISMQFDLAMDAIKGFFKSNGGDGIIAKVKGWITPVREFFSSIGTNFAKTIDGWKDEFKIWKEYLGPVVTKIKTLVMELFDVGARFDDVKGFFNTIKDTISGWVKNIFNKVKDVLGLLGGGDSVLAKIGKFFGKFLAPVTFLFTLWDTVKGAIDGYENGGIIGAVKGALSGFLSSIVGEPLNLIKNLASWILEKLGFENIAKSLDAFDFTKFISNTISGVFNWIKTLFTDPTEALSELWQNIVGKGGLMDLIWSPIDAAINWLMEKFGFVEEGAPKFSMGDMMRTVWNTLLDWVASLVEAIPLVGKKGAAMIRALQAGEATVSVEKLGAKETGDKAKTVEKQVPEKVSNNSGDQLQNAAADKKNTDVVAEAARDSAIMSGVGNTGSSGGGSSTVNASSNTSNIHIQQGNLPDRTDWSVMSGSFGLAP